MKNLEIITQKIHEIRNQKVMLDYDLAALYEIENRTLKQAVKRNISRFPDDFMFILTDNEINKLVSQSVIPSKSYFGGSYPFAFTEQGVAHVIKCFKKLKSDRNKHLNNEDVCNNKTIRIELY